MLLRLAAERRLLFFGGKGGVGKTTTASAVALAEAERGRRVLLVSTDPAHNLGHLWQRRIGPDAVEIAPNLEAMELDPQGIADAHLDQVGRSLRRLMPANLSGEVDRQLALARQAPGLHEAALLERIADLVHHHFHHGDGEGLLIFDTAPSGHTARLLALPELMSTWTEGLLRSRQSANKLGDAFRRMNPDEVARRTIGSPDRDDQILSVLERRRLRFASLRDHLKEQANTAFVLVLMAERLPVLESIELRGQLADQGIPVGALVVNRRSPQDAGELLEQRRGQEAACLKDLAAALPDLPIVETPLLATEPVGAEALHQLARHWGNGSASA
ncbi:Arsenite-transporting ATPase [Thiorhodococcus drewsii AZ1]|uniref:arsenite-transporting ATPase n=1 Tax=Thiorhodococcus drewsii AZ1 TaxID=765913 RepID=G2E158_9GAMM|nr:ArsA family ATPase [Thiorhodococcus drewsii]EGV31399.1 Arsenite-transporting ATPase [Thiorhodococcus drewsii AZ1]